MSSLPSVVVHHDATPALDPASPASPSTRIPKWVRSAEERILPPPDIPGQPATLYFDLETSPQLNYAWGSSKYSSRPLRVAKPRYILSVAYGWEPPPGEPFTTHFIGLHQDPKYRPDPYYRRARPGIDRWVKGALWQLFEKADVVVAHNGKRFDVRRTNARFITERIPPPLPYAQLDTLLEYRAVADFASNRLDDLAHELGLPGKYHHPGIDMWMGCLEGDLEMWGEMEKYNHQDVVTLREVWFGVRPYARATLNAAAYATLNAPTACPTPTCGGTAAHMVFRKNRTLKSGLVYRQYQCRLCRKYARSRYADPYSPKPKVRSTGVVLF